MANKSSFTIQGNLDISNITRGISDIRKQISNANLGEALSTDLSKDITLIEQKVNKLFTKMPGASATSKQVEKFANELMDLGNNIELFSNKAKGFNITDTYLKNNIATIKQFSAELTKAANSQATLIDQINNVPLHAINPDAKAKGLVGTAEKDMRKNAMAGNTVGVSATFNKISSDLSNRINSTQDEGRKEALKQELQAITVEFNKFLPLAEQMNTILTSQSDIEGSLNTEITKYRTNLRKNTSEIATNADEIKRQTDNEEDHARAMADSLGKLEEQNRSLNNLAGRVKDFFSVASMFSLVRRVIRGAFDDLKELDTQFNEIAIVSKYSTKEMWQSFSDVNAMAQEYGVTTKNILEVQNLYYHQGKDMAEVNKLTAQTLTLAKITGMDYADATNKMTAALNAYKIEAEDAARVTDSVAALSANAATDSQELMTALTKTASISANAGMSLENTEIFLTKMIETTREAPENLGTALKTIVARFGEVKQEIDGQEIELADINRVDTALKTIGVTLLDSAGQIRDLDDVFMELSSKWDGLDRNTQRYIATIAAGSRQQSRFIAMMENYDRTLELVDVAQNSAGTGAAQLAKAQESIQSSIDRLKSSWQEFYSTFITAGMIKQLIELTNGFVSLLNAANDIVPGLGLVVAAIAALTVKKILLSKVTKTLVTTIAEGIVQAQAKNAEDTKSVGLLGLLSAKTGKLSGLMTALSAATEAAAKAQEHLNDAQEGNSSKKDEWKKQGWIDDKGKITDAGREHAKKNRDKKIEQKEKGWIDDIGELTDKGKIHSELDKNKDIWTKWLNSRKQELKNTKDFFQSSNKKQMVQGFKQKSILKMKGVKAGLQGGLSSLKTGLMAKLTPILAKIVPMLTGISKALSMLLNPITAIIAALGVAFYAYRKIMGARMDDTKEVKKQTEAQDKYNNSLQELNTLRDNAKIIKKYDKQELSALTPEQLQEQQAAAKALVEEYPNLLKSIDEEGQYHLKNTEEIEKEIDAKERLVKTDSEALTKIKLANAKKGVYADTSTTAGAAMQNIQDYAKSLDKKTLRQMTKEIDKNTVFNGSKFKSIMKKYAAGKKTSFGSGDFTDLFAGDISPTQWRKMMEEVSKNNGKLDTTILETYGGYSKENAKKVLEAFNAVDSQLGGIYSQLLKGAAEEYSQINIQHATLLIDSADFPFEMDSDTKEGIVKAADKEVQKLPGYEKMSSQERTDELTKITNRLIESWKKVSATNFEIQKSFVNKDKIGSLKVKQAGNFNMQAEGDQARRATLISFYSQLQDGVNQLDTTFIQEASADVINSLFEKTILAMGDMDIQTLTTNLASQYEASVVNSSGNKINFLERLQDLTIDQVKVLQSTFAELKTEQIAPYVNTLFSKINEQTSDLEKNALLKVKFDSTTNIMEATKELSKFGYTAQDVSDMAVTSMNGINNISLSSFEDTLANVTSLVEEITKGLEGMSALLEGKASLAQMGQYLTFLSNQTQFLIGKYGEGSVEASSAIQNFNLLSNSIIATSEGFKIGEDAAGEYGKTTVDVAKSMILSTIAIHKAQLMQEDLSAAERLQTESNIALLGAVYSYIDASEKAAKQKKLQDNLNDTNEKIKQQRETLEKARESAEKYKETIDQLRDSLQALVDWLHDYDRFSNLDEAISSLQEEFDHIDFQINFSTNADVIKQSFQDQISNINTQIAANQGGISAAKDEQEMWKNVIVARNSRYVSFDEAGNAIKKGKELKKLQEEISKADEEHQKVLKAEYDEVIKNVDSYNQAKDKVEEYTKALEENFSQLADFEKNLYDNITTLEDKLIDLRMKKEDKELERIKKTYERKKEEDEKYLDSVRKIINKEREIREDKKNKQKVRDKERKLALMKRDTSGIYAREIQSLEDEILEDYQSLEDNAVDKQLSQMEEAYNETHQRMDDETAYLDYSLSQRRQSMTEYNLWVSDLMQQGSDAIISYMQENDEEYYTGTQAKQDSLNLGWEEMVTKGQVSNDILSSDLINTVFNAFDSCKENAGGFEDSIIQYTDTAKIKNGEVESSLSSLSTYFSNLASNITSESGLVGAFHKLADAYKKAEDAAKRLKAINDQLAKIKDPPKPPKTSEDPIIGDTVPNVEPASTIPNIIPDTDPKKDTETYIEHNTIDDFAVAKDKKGNVDTVSWWDSGDGSWEKRQTADWGTKKLIKVENQYHKIIWVEDDPESAVEYESGGKKYMKLKKGAVKYIPRWGSGTGATRSFDTGGYTGNWTGNEGKIAMLHKKERVLNASQTAAFEKLVDILDFVFKKPTLPELEPSSQNNGDVVYNLHINVEELSKDYDVDQMIKRIEKKIKNASKFRNINIVNKQNN